MRKEYIQQLLSLTKKQQELLKEENLEAFQGVMQEKEMIIDKVIGYNEKNGKGLILEERLLLEEVQNIDKQNHMVFEQQFNKVKKKLCEIRRNKVKSNSYNNPYGVWQEEGIFFDKK